jgi:D-3-phosphoglycerate dehydrogenase
MQPFTRKVIQKLNKCKLIHNLGLGYEGIDIAAATEHGICVSWPAGYCLEEVSDHTMALILACARKLLRQYNAVKAGKWTSLEKPEIRLKLWPPMFRLRGQTLGIIGFGNIARTLVPKAKGFGLRIIVYDPYVPSEIFKEYGVESVDFDFLLQNSDYISVHTALTPETRHMLGMKEFKKMKPSAFLINTARGEIIDEQGLYVALTEGYIAGAGLDVLEDERSGIIPDHPLLKLDNVIVTPHSAHYSEESALEIRCRPFEEISRIIEGEWPRHFLNPQVKEKFINRWGKLGR